MQILKKIFRPYLSILLIIFGAFFCSAQTSGTREYQVKAVFVFNFTQFVEWPSQCFSTPQSQAVIGILGKNPFGNYLEETITGEAIGKHPLAIQNYTSVDEVTNCHVLFINTNDKSKIKQIIEKLKGKNILTISDSNEFCKLGGMIRLYTKNDKINIQINLEEAKEANLVISSKLLKLAEIVKTDKK